MALIRATTRGGKTGRTAPARTLLESREAFSEEALSPFAHHRPRHVQALTDLLVVQALGGEEHDPGTDHVSIR